MNDIKVGDKVVCIDNNYQYWLKKNTIYTVEECSGKPGEQVHWIMISGHSNDVDYVNKISYLSIEYFKKYDFRKEKLKTILES